MNMLQMMGGPEALAGLIPKIPCAPCLVLAEVNAATVVDAPATAVTLVGGTLMCAQHARAELIGRHSLDDPEYRAAVIDQLRAEVTA